MSIPRIAPYPMPKALPEGRATWSLSASRAALLVHDMQQYFVDFFDATQPPVPALLQHCAQLISHCRQLGVPVIYTAQPGAQNPADRALLTDFWGAGLADRSEMTRIVAALAPQEGDIVLTKWRYSAFKRSDLEAQLRAMGRDQLLICGVYAHIGCLMTAAEAFMLDVQPFMVGDALADFSAEEHEMALHYAADRCARVCSTAAALASLQAPKLSLAALRTEVAEQIGMAPALLADDDDLLLMGLDSVRLMSLMERWKLRGLRAEFAELAENPTLHGWLACLSGAAATEAA
ncbi:MAG: isochorismatase family protein [Pseudomonadota bacterium]|jgi:bifunctional isochorismate lyase / aryl carrier protein|nr:isochorismatase family protein [Pseudomonadota bacterium]